MSKIENLKGKLKDLLFKSKDKSADRVSSELFKYIVSNPQFKPVLDKLEVLMDQREKITDILADAQNALQRNDVDLDACLMLLEVGLRKEEINLGVK